MLGPVQHSGLRLSAPQWQSAAELTNYGRGRDLPRFAPPHMLQDPMAAAPASARPADDIEDDD